MDAICIIVSGLIEDADTQNDNDDEEEADELEFSTHRGNLQYRSSQR